uniref:Uncharacterized protein n=1 Tax=Panagrolaimus davidi TaxID=227884 RepID=A0A914Q2C2_9BILA
MISVKALWDPFPRAFINACIISGTALVSFIFNLSALYCLISSKKHIINVRSEIHKAEVGLFLITCYDICIDFTYGVQQVC